MAVTALHALRDDAGFASYSAGGMVFPGHVEPDNQCTLAEQGLNIAQGQALVVTPPLRLDARLKEAARHDQYHKQKEYQSKTLAVS
jgi:hypothetical protein